MHLIGIRSCRDKLWGTCLFPFYWKMCWTLDSILQNFRRNQNMEKSWKSYVDVLYRFIPREWHPPSLYNTQAMYFKFSGKYIIYNMHRALFDSSDFYNRKFKRINKFILQKIWSHREENWKNCSPQTLTLSEPVIEVSLQ